MKKYDYIAFDLDGTLTDPAQGLVAGFLYAFKKMGMPYGTPNELRRFIGPPLFEAWQKEFSLTHEQTDRLILTFREYYNIFGWWDNKLYSGIPELLSELKARGKTLVVATSKPEDTAKKVLSLFEIDKYFDFIGGADGHKTRDKKWEVLDYSLSAVGIPGSSPLRDKCIMVGDRSFDADGAQKCGIDAMGVLWGHGSKEELSMSGFKYIAENIYEALNILK